MYRWRKLTDDDRLRALARRQTAQHPIHSPRHFDSGQCHYLITAACFEHVGHIGHSVDRMSDLAAMLLAMLRSRCTGVTAWTVLPNHYHALVATKDVLILLKALGEIHGRTSFDWNGEENTRGRQVWCKATETVIKSTGHFNASINYVHHNPVKHRYVSKWTDWPCSSAEHYLNEVGSDEAERIWRAHPIDDYGKGWDDADL
jgi:putative transposase